VEWSSFEKEVSFEENKESEDIEEEVVVSLFGA
jgi:hypothetical protein